MSDSNVFYTDDERDIKISYGELLENAHAYAQNNSAKRNEVLHFFTQFIIAAANDLDVIIKDNYHIQLQETEKEITWDLLNTDSIYPMLQSSKSEIILYSSGTTASPKKINLPIQKLIDAVKLNPRQEKKVWGLCYNPGHIAALSVCMQAISTNSTLVNLFQQPLKAITKSIDKFQITNLSASPSFYRLLDGNHIFENITQVTSGGEILDKSTYKIIHKIFPNARVTNLYATTETGILLKSANAIFTIPKTLKEKIKIEDNELLVHNSMLNYKELKNEWYRTGDKIEFVNQDLSDFKIIGRTHNQFNISGYNVNLEYINQEVQSFHKVVWSRLIPRKNSINGYILEAEITWSEGDPRINEKELRSFLKEKLPKYLIPRIIRTSEKPSLSRNGKTEFH